MKQLRFFFYAFLCLYGSLLSAYVEPYCATPPHITPRSQGQHSERLNVGLANYLTKAASDSHYGTFSITPAYSRSFRPTDLASAYFGDFLKTNRSITIAGPAATPAANTTTDLLAKWFYLPDTYRGTMYFTPRIQNIIAEADLYWGMDPWAEGLFLRVNTPFVHTSWDPHLISVVEQVGQTTDNEVTYLDDQLDYFCKEEVLTGAPYPIKPLSYTRICPTDCFKNGFADIHSDLGWKFLIDDNFHLGGFIRLVIPTGTRNDGKLLFAPVIGNGHHTELGGGITSSILMWNNEECEDRLGLYLDCSITHLFKTKECRVFDLKGKPLSRYMLGVKIVQGNVTTVAPLANITASEVDVKVNVQADLSLWLDYTHKNMTADFGYNFWARSCEKVSCPKNCSTCSSCCPNVIAQENNWGIFDFDNGTASGSTIVKRVGSDAQPVFILPEDFDYKGGATRGMSHTLFGHIAYNWFDNINVPYIGLGGSVEFSRSSGCKPASLCACYKAQRCSPCCRFAALSQWSLWVKGGIAF